MGELKKFKPYELYSDTNAVWYKQKPAHWVCERFKYNFREKKKKNATELPAGSISFGEVILKNEDNLSQDTKESYQEVLAGEFLINPLNLNFDLKSLRTALSTINVVVSTGYIVLQGCGLLHSRFARWLLQQFDVSHMKTLGAGVRQTINYADIGNSIFCRPTLKEQKVIAAFLDHETAKIDNLIEKQQQLIELLKEKRQAVISHAVTKGLNPDVPMKDSGVEWLGEVPEHWGVTRLKYECRNIVDCPHSTPNYTDEGEYPAIRTADILAGYLDLDNCRRVTKSIFDERNFRLIPKAGDIIYSREGERFGIGAPIPEGAKVCLAQRVMLFRAKSTPGYLMWALNSSSTYSQAQQDCIGATSPHVNVDTIKNFILPWPPEKEREEISNFIYQTLDSIESLTVHLTEKLTLLRERRTALISAAVTGKIDVRDWVAPDAQDIEAIQEATA
ncbi:restriction endonuclease subunit S [Enterobacter kobei]|uniref:restriction endonuclease subunit S n=1 Tax=Enterobacter kobei TaxID=208224 RepID=UPI002FCFBB27